ncbi:MAG: hypothetical protein ACMUHX_02380 [bacterium]
MPLDSHTIPIVRPLKKSFVIVALIFLFIGFAIEYGVPIPSFEKKASKDESREKFAKEYWQDVKDEVINAIKTAKKSPDFEIQIEEKSKDLEIFGFKIEAENEEDEEEDPIKVTIKFSSSDQEMLEEAKDKVIKEKWRKSQGESTQAAKDRGLLKEKGEKPPGFCLEADGLFLWIIFFSMLISLIGMLVSKASVQRVGMIVSLVNSIVIIFMSIFLIIKAVTKLIIMFLLIFSGFLSFLYPIIYEFPFPTGRILGVAGSGLFCKVVSAILLWIGGSNIIRIKSSTILLISGFVTSIIIMIVLPIAKALLAASIADAIIGIIIAIVVIVWSIFILIGSIRGLVSSAI